ncbi:hypothetical protein HanXRQr2_Chr16g0777901 [Helianthus annuus]|uniref:Uncharacterized protein n=1 Tax=Helianthus annuus TaxID=4232 RepID=A0A9K3DX37_HELAN|nr:hypothetical protein HanXRQr2_Chr16g0777901 [Helianthus annuus]KAJ0823663.1 hypothetical protein HanPSC8_Chr16g0746281 [Helianthus annuus]
MTIKKILLLCVCVVIELILLTIDTKPFYIFDTLKVLLLMLHIELVCKVIDNVN